MIFGGVEAGGTKFICVVGSGPNDVRAQTRIATTTPEQTLGSVNDFFQKYVQDSKETLSAIGIACFGPIDLDPSSPTYGYITATPKVNWSNTNVVGVIQDKLQVPTTFDTDVNVAAIGEGTWGAAKGLDYFIYLTIGTGIGGGGLFNGKPLHGLVHPEMGHLRLPHDWEKDPFAGTCPFHGDCWEGLACGPAIEKRWGKRGETLGSTHEAWDLEAHYIALALQDLITSMSPRRIILGGGVMQQETLYPIIRQKVQEYLAGYIRSKAILDDIEHYIVAPGLGSRSGVLGALALAQQLVH
jgi:fructokinase